MMDSILVVELDKYEFLYKIRNSDEPGYRNKYSDENVFAIYENLLDSSEKPYVVFCLVDIMCTYSEEPIEDFVKDRFDKEDLPKDYEELVEYIKDNSNEYIVNVDKDGNVLYIG